jgi:lipopolysaccharide export system protein LptC
MRAVAYRLYPLAIVAVLAGGSIWLEHLTRSDEPVVASDKQAPDFLADTVQIVGFADDGSRRYTLNSPQVTHLPQSDTTAFDLPRLQLVSSNRLLQITADRGEAGPEGKQVDFVGNVEAERDSGSPTGEPLHLSTAQLTVWPEEQRAVSEVPVTVTSGSRRADANRMEADNLFGNLKLSGKVRMNFPPKQRNP